MPRVRFSLLTLAAIVAYSVIGCGSLFTESEPVKPIDPPPVKEVAAQECLIAYGHGIADAFEASAKQFDDHVPSVQVVDTMGDSLKQSRIDSFMPLMKRLNELSGDDAGRAKQLREWAGQLRQGDKP